MTRDEALEHLKQYHVTFNEDRSEMTMVRDCPTTREEDRDRYDLLGFAYDYGRYDHLVAVMADLFA